MSILGTDIKYPRFYAFRTIKSPRKVIQELEKCADSNLHLRNKLVLSRIVTHDVAV